MGRKIVKKYNKVTKKWENKVVNVKDEKKDNDKPKSTTQKDKSTGGGMTTPSTDPKSAKGKAAKKKNKTEYYTLSGTLKLLPTKSTISIKCNNVVKLKNLGSYLSGKYYVASVTRTIDSNGYSQELELFKPNFREQFKKKEDKSKEKKKKNKSATKSANQALNKGSGSKGLLRSSAKSVASSGTTASDTSYGEVDTTNLIIHTISKPSETLWTIAKRYYGDSSRWKSIYLLNTGESPDPLNLKIGMKLVIP